MTLNLKTCSKFSLISLILALVGLNHTPATAQSNNTIEYRVTAALLKNDFAACEKSWDSILCKKIFQRFGVSEEQTTENKIFSVINFGSIYEYLKVCENKKSQECIIFSAAFSEKNDDSCANTTNAELCLEVKNYHKKNCSPINDPLLKSSCNNQINPACEKDLSCKILWGIKQQIHSKKNAPSSIDAQRAIGDYLKESASLISLINHQKQKTRNTGIIPNTFQPKPKQNIKIASTQNPNKTCNSKNPNLPYFTLTNHFEIPSKRTLINLLQPWNRGTALTVLDWNEDGKSDLFATHGKIIYLFENLGNDKFKKHIINLNNFISSLSLIDISVQKNNNEIRIIAQDYPNHLHILKWNKARNAFLLSTFETPNNSRTHILFSTKNAEKILLPGFTRSSLTPITQDYFLHLDGDKIQSQNLLNNPYPTISAGVLTGDNFEKYPYIAKDIGGGISLLDPALNKATRVPNILISHSISQLKLKDKILTFVSGIGRENNSEHNFNRENISNPKNISECDKNDYEACLLLILKNKIKPFFNECKKIKNKEFQAICSAQFLHQPNENHIESSLDLNGDHRIYSSIQNNELNTPWTKKIENIDTIWHTSPIQFEKGPKGFFIAEGSLNQTRKRRLLWLYTTCDSSNCEPELIDITEQFSDQNHLIDSSNFSISDFNNDGAPDIAFYDHTGISFYSGNWCASGYTPNINNQSGFLSKDFTVQ